MVSRASGLIGLCAACCLIGLALVPARAGAAPLNVDVDCPAMTPEQLASVEARTRAELAMLGAVEGEIEIHCWPPLALVQYSTGTVPVRTHSRHISGAQDAWVEQILSIVHGLFAAESVTVPPAVEPAAAPEQAEQPLAAQQPANLTEAAMQKPRAALPRVASGWKPESPKAESLVAQTSIGTCAEFWAKPLEILPGVCALFGLRSSFSRIALGGGVQWAASRVHDITIRHWQGGVEWSLGHPVWFALSSHLSVFQLDPSASLLPNSSTTYDPSVTLRGGISLPAAGEHLRAGAGIRLQPGHEVRVNGRSVFSVPMIALALDLAYELEL